MLWCQRMEHIKLHKMIPKQNFTMADVKKFVFMKRNPMDIHSRFYAVIGKIYDNDESNSKGSTI